MKKLTIIPVLAFAIAASGAAAKDDKQKAVAENFTEADANADGKLDKTEFKKMIDLNAADNIGNASKVKSYNMYDRAFGRLDANKDGYVTPDEMKAAK